MCSKKVAFHWRLDWDRGCRGRAWPNPVQITLSHQVSVLLRPIHHQLLLTADVHTL